MTVRKCDRCGKFFDSFDEIVVIFRMDYDMLERGDKEDRDELYVFHGKCFDEAPCKVCQFQDKLDYFETHQLEQVRDLAASEIDLRNSAGDRRKEAVRKTMPGGECHA